MEIGWHELSGKFEDYMDPKEYEWLSGVIIDGKPQNIRVKKSEMTILRDNGLNNNIVCNCMGEAEENSPIRIHYDPVGSQEYDNSGYNTMQSDYHGSGLIEPPDPKLKDLSEFYDKLRVEGKKLSSQYRTGLGNKAEWWKIGEEDLIPPGLRLHLGCGSKHIDGYVNIDCRYQPGVDEINNVEFLRNYKENSVDEIYACHVLEHLGRWNYQRALERWYEILKPGGILKVAVPDFKQIVKIYTNNKYDLSKIIGLLYGGQDYDNNIHTYIWDFGSMKIDLTSIGFKDIKPYDWRETPHANVDDFSQCYIPHMDKENGTLMSLNIQATK